MIDTDRTTLLGGWCQVTEAILPPEIASVADKFTLANGY